VIGSICRSARIAKSRCRARIARRTKRPPHRHYNVATANNTVVATIDVGLAPFGVAATPDGGEVYVTNLNNTVSVIPTANNAVSSTVSVGNGPVGVAFTTAARRTSPIQFDHTVSVIATATNAVVATVDVGTSPIVFGVFIRPRFAGAPVSPTLSRHQCHAANATYSITSSTVARSCDLES
jgi:YVTN family beta-propeller protein